MIGRDSKIHFLCDECGTKFVAAIEQAGKSGKCNNCGSSISVPILEEFKDSKSIVKEPVSTNQTECPSCRKTVNKENGFCPNCGNSLVSKSAQADGHSEKFCRECGNSLRTDARFCDNCGSSTPQKTTLKTTGLEDSTDKPLAAETQPVKPVKKKENYHSYYLRDYDTIFPHLFWCFRDTTYRCNSRRCNHHLLA